ncbi:hypothetical protein CHUAL_008680 [Chamberlinius hualienensis]
MFRFLNIIYLHSYLWVRSIFKWFIHQTTNLCEIQRICYGQDVKAKRAITIEYSLRYSRNKIIQSLVQQMEIFCTQRRLNGMNGHNLVEYSATAIIKAKRIKADVNPRLFPILTVCLAQIYGYKQLTYEVEFVRKIPYQSENPEHEHKLYGNFLMPGIPLTSRISKQWGDIGFQGDDPKTDFRGMGMLGLENLLYFSSHYTPIARQVLSHSHHPKYGYSFAIVGINLTSMACDLLNKNHLQTHMYNVLEGRPSMKHFNQIYVYLFYEFDKLWISSKPKNIMEFGRIKDQFQAAIMKRLKDTNCIFKLNFPVETI